MVAITLVAGAAVFGFVNSQSGLSASAVGNNAAANINFLNEKEVVVFAQVTSATSVDAWVYNSGSINPMTLKSALVSSLGSSGSATGGSSSTLVDNTRNWNVNFWAGFSLTITGGTGAGQVRTVSSNTPTTISVSTVWATSPDSTSTYSISGGIPVSCIVPGTTIPQYASVKFSFTCPFNTFQHGTPSPNTYLLQVVGQYGSASQTAVGY